MAHRIANNNGRNFDKYKEELNIQVDVEAFNRLYLNMNSMLGNKSAKVYEVTYNVKDWTYDVDRDTHRKTKLRKTIVRLIVTDSGSLLVIHRGWNIEAYKQYYLRQGDQTYYFQRYKQPEWNVSLPEMFIPIEDDMVALIEYIKDDLKSATSLRVKELSKIDEWLNSGNILVETVRARKA